MFTAALTRPADSSASNTVTAFRERCSSFRLKITSRIARVVPAARIAPNEEPYSTTRSSPRWYQTRCGISCTSGWPPVAIDDRQTGVSDGNVVTARRYSPSFIRKRRRGHVVRLHRAFEHGRREAVDDDQDELLHGALVPGERAQAGVALSRAPAEPHSERGHGHRLDVAEHGDERERRDATAPSRTSRAVPRRVPPRPSAPRTSSSAPTAPSTPPTPAAAASSASASTMPSATPTAPARKGATSANRRPPNAPAAAIPRATPRPANTPIEYQSPIAVQSRGRAFRRRVARGKRGNDRPIRGVRPAAAEASSSFFPHGGRGLPDAWKASWRSSRARSGIG